MAENIINKNLNSAMDEYSQKVYGPNGIAFNSPNKLQYDIDANAAAARVPSQVIEQTYPGMIGQTLGTLSDLTMPALALGSSPFYDMYQAGDRARAEYGIFNDSDPNVLGVTGDSEIPMGPSFPEYAKAVAAENIPSSMIGRTLGAGQNLADRFKSGNFPLSLNNVMDMGRSIKDGLGNFFFSPAGAAEISPTTNRNFDRDFSQLPSYGDAVSGTNVQGMDYEADLGAFMNPNIQPSQNMFQRAGNFINDLDLEEYLPFIGERSLTGIMGRGLGKVGRGIGSLFNAPYRGATRGGGGYTIDQLNRQNARGGYYTDTARSQRRDAASIQNMINRAASGKNYGANRLDKLGKEAGMSSEDISRAITDRKTAAPSHIGNDNTTGTGGGKIVCTMMNDSYGFGNFRNKIWLKHSRDLPKEYEVGYHKIFLPLVKFAKGEGKINKVVKKTLEHVARHRTLDLKQEMKGKTHILGRVYRKILEPICFLVGKASMFTRRG